ncbi:helix-turn-helix domain-containing protein [Fusobacterium periodonticum]|uniref:DNA-binding protein n=1 Tax=Fusobacterium periodonticum 1_1_41FAA TaxID=469621 RepID=D6LEL7_9FUSO|nr:helix-turn-helix domain-containing protein [Fusobacterium periodonticum]EFG28602.1 DNA-binding helix-turn-helix protein [Fusobacterium periodonticum 1_1_41FAA]DAR89075.1 MAG TPA: Helix-turn-helix XRE-family like protein [Caudoviricetes sp.]
MDIANILKIIRKKYKLTQKEIAKIIGVSHQTISLIERGDYKASKKTVNSLIKNFTLEFKEKTYSKKEITEFEKEVLETYEMLREEKNPFSAIASFKRSLINLNQEISKTSININTLEENPEFKKISIRLKRPIKTTLKYLDLIKNQLIDILNDDYIILEEDDFNESE